MLYVLRSHLFSRLEPLHIKMPHLGHRPRQKHHKTDQEVQDDPLLFCSAAAVIQVRGDGRSVKVKSFIHEADEKLQQSFRSLLMAEVTAAWEGGHPGSP